MSDDNTITIRQRFSTLSDLRTTCKFCLSAADHHWKLCHGKLLKLVRLCVYIFAKWKSNPCSRTTR